MTSHRQLGMTRICAACDEPATLVETLGAATVCTPCISRLRAHARSMKARERQARRGPGADIRAAFRNDERRKHRSTR